jgi:hypothetical protein
MMIEAMSSVTKLIDARPQFPNDMRREPCRKNATSVAIMAHPAAAMPIA